MCPLLNPFIKPSFTRNCVRNVIQLRPDLSKLEIVLQFSEDTFSFSICQEKNLVPHLGHQIVNAFVLNPAG